MTNVKFSSIMFAYAMENQSNPTDLLVSIPDVFIDMSYNTTVSKIYNKPESSSLFRNKVLPTMSNAYAVRNYMRLPVIKTFGGTATVNTTSIISNGNNLIINSDGKETSSVNIGIGDVKKGDKVIVAFINENPQLGYIIARA